jgi:gamma-glutamylputrescine oxidase
MTASTTDAVLADDFRDTPYWWDAAPPAEGMAGPLPGTTEVAIVGSGYTGLCCAIGLAERGTDCAVLDAGALGEGASSRSGGMVTGGQKFVVSGAIRGLDTARQQLILEDAHESLTALEARIATYHLEADYARTGRVILANVPRHYARLTHWASLLERAGSAVSLLDRMRLQTEVNGRRYHGGLLIEDYGGLHPGKYHRSLRTAAARRGVKLFSRATVRRLQRTPQGFVLSTDKGEIVAREVVIGTNGYTGGLVPYLQRRIVPVAAYVVATEQLPPGMMDSLVPRRRMLSDTQRSLYWFRPAPDGTRIIFGARPRVREVDARTAAGDLHRMLCDVWPQLRDIRIAFCWRGNIGMSADHIPHMGVHDGIHYALGCNGSGVAMMSYLGTQMANKILGQQNRPCAFDSSMFPAIPAFGGKPWFVPLVSGWYRLCDRFDHMTAAFE